MIDIKLLGPTDLNILNNVAENVFDDPIVKSSAQEFLTDPRHRLVVGLENNVVVGFVSAVIYVHPDKLMPIDMSSEDAMKLVVSCGAYMPGMPSAVDVIAAPDT